MTLILETSVAINELHLSLIIPLMIAVSIMLHFSKKNRKKRTKDKTSQKRHKR